MLQKAVIADAKPIQDLISSFAQKRIMLPRALNYVYENLRDFWVWKEEGKILGCCALHVVGWEGLAEVKSLSVHESLQKKGIGKILVDKCISEAKELGLTQVFALTFVPEFFLKCDFHEITKEALPHKIWSDCIDCPFFPNCEEIAVLKKI
jgi:amino-acid N-acetyltransferase